jgi:2-octaprenyl-6-methoxyphenol hydroxylase
MIGIGASQSNYGQRAVVGNLQTEKSLDHCAFERFTKCGPLALLPAAGDRAGFVWTVSEQDAERVLGLEDDTFLEELQQAFGYRLGRFSRVGKRAAYALVLTKAARLTGQRAVLVGNAAHGLHPVAAQGFNLGMRDVAALSDCIADARASGDGFDPGSAELLERYANWRRSDQQKLVGFTDGLVRLFGSSSRPLRFLRDIGMLAFDLVPGVRSLFAKHTMGLAGRLPRLSRGLPLT